jgi:hypothetical protein
VVTADEMRTGWRALLRDGNPLGLPSEVPYLLGRRLDAIGRFPLHDLPTGEFVGDVQPSQVVAMWLERRA